MSARITPGRKESQKLFGQHGWSVWWDRMLLAGDRFDKAIQQALHAAKHACRLVFLRRVRPHASVALAELRAALEVRRSRNSPGVTKFSSALNEAEWNGVVWRLPLRMSTLGLNCGKRRTYSETGSFCETNLPEGRDLKIPTDLNWKIKPKNHCVLETKLPLRQGRRRHFWKITNLPYENRDIINSPFN